MFMEQTLESQKRWVNNQKIFFVRLLRQSTDVQFANLFKRYETEKDRLIVRAVNYSQNEFQFEEMVYRCYEDIALVLYVMLYNDERGFEL